MLMFYRAAKPIVVHALFVLVGYLERLSKKKLEEC